MIWHLPQGYQSRLEPDYHYDEPHNKADIVHQPEAYEVVRYFLNTTPRKTVLDIGCGSGRKLRDLPAHRAIGVDYKANIAFCRTAYPDWGEWIEADFSDVQSRAVAKYAGPDTIVICADVMEHMPDPTQLLALLAECYRRGAIVVTSTPDRVRVRGAEHIGPPPNLAHVREWERNEYEKVIADAGMGVTFSGYTVNNSAARELKTILTLSDPDICCHAIPRNRQRPLAIIAAYNEVDMIEEVIADWLAQGCDVHLIDNWSTDGTWEAVRRCAVMNPGRIELERFPDVSSATYEWVPILHRKADIAARHSGRWIIHSDADEIRRSPFPGVRLADAFDLVAATGANRVDFRVINFRPVDASEVPQGRIERTMRWFEFGTRPGHLKQWKAWLQGRSRVDLASTGGHEVRFDGTSNFPYKFLLKHYPLRSEAHARRKIEHERQARRSLYEYKILRFHTHYDRFTEDNLTFQPEANLREWHDDTFWPDHGLLIMTDLLGSRVERGWMEGGK